MEKEIADILGLLKTWAYAHGPRIILIIVGAWVLTRVTRLAGKKIIQYTEDDDPTTKSEREKRAETLVHIVRNGVKIFVYIVASFMVLKELGVDIAPLLAGAGIAGLAIGFGALYPDFRHQNIGQVATGFGGVMYMIFSTLFMALVILLEAGPVYILFMADIKEKAVTLSQWLFIGPCFAVVLVIMALTVVKPMKVGLEAIERYE